jgi:hypothetical protein
MNLTFINNVVAWIGNSSTTDNAMLARLIGVHSSAILAYLQRPNLALATYTETLSGRGTKSIMLRNWPVTAVSSLSVQNTNVPAAPDCNSYGYLLETWDGSLPGKPQLLMMNGYVGGGPVNGYNGWNQPYSTQYVSAGFLRGMNNIQITYQAGYAVSGEAQTVGISTETGLYTLNPLVPNGPWLSDNGVTYANGNALTKVASGPTTGQYAVSQNAASGIVTYTFSSGDNNAAVLLNYSYIPFEIETACIEWVSERYRYRQRIGESSHSLGGQETTSFSIKAMPDYIKMILQPYRKMVPL